MLTEARQFNQTMSIHAESIYGSANMFDPRVCQQRGKEIEISRSHIRAVELIEIHPHGRRYIQQLLKLL